MSFYRQATNSKGDDVTLPEPAITNVLDNGELDNSISKTETGSASRNTVETGQNNPEVASPIPGENKDVGGDNLSNIREITKEAGEVAHDNTQDAVEVGKAEASTIKSNDVFLNIRLPDGSSLQAKFFMTDTLKMVKAYINENQTISLGSFSIAIPYPRKVFNDQGVLLLLILNKLFGLFYSNYEELCHIRMSFIRTNSPFQDQFQTSFFICS